jgi:acyl-coenzyme A synthetase/AMP-(fatty) acid ligase
MFLCNTIEQAYNQGRIEYISQMGYTSGTSAVPKRAVRVG